MSRDRAAGVAQGLRKTLDGHGFGFHYAAINKADSLYPDDSSWLLSVSEFPVNVKGQDTRIDFILRHQQLPHRLIVECKRANPALSDWCFTRAPYVRRNRESEIRAVLAEKVERSHGRNVFSGPERVRFSKRVYDLAFEIKSNRPGDPASKGRGQIERAATQVCRGMHGLVEAYGENLPMLEKGDSVVLVPAVFTTATIWTSEVDLTAADLETGTLEEVDVAVERRDWIWYRYHLSPSLTSTLSRGGTEAELSDLLDSKYARTIGIVSAPAIQPFLASEEWHN